MKGWNINGSFQRLAMKLVIICGKHLQIAKHIFTLPVSGSDVRNGSQSHAGFGWSGFPILAIQVYKRKSMRKVDYRTYFDTSLAGFDFNGVLV